MPALLTSRPRGSSSTGGVPLGPRLQPPDYVRPPATRPSPHHLARHRDHEAAAKLRRAQGGRPDYPLEWTRAVAGPGRRPVQARHRQRPVGRPTSSSATSSSSANCWTTTQAISTGGAAAAGGKLAPILAARACATQGELTSLAGDADRPWPTGAKPGPGFPCDGPDEERGRRVGCGSEGGTWRSPPAEAHARVMSTCCGPGLPAEGVRRSAAFFDADGQPRRGALRLPLRPRYAVPGAGRPGLPAGAARPQRRPGGEDRPGSTASRSPAGLTVDVVADEPRDDVRGGGPRRAGRGADAGRRADRPGFGPAHLDRPFESCRASDPTPPAGSRDDRAGASRPWRTALRLRTAAPAGARPAGA